MNIFAKSSSMPLEPHKSPDGDFILWNHEATCPFFILTRRGEWKWLKVWLWLFCSLYVCADGCCNSTFCKNGYIGLYNNDMPPPSLLEREVVGGSKFTTVIINWMHISLMLCSLCSVWKESIPVVEKGNLLTGLLKGFETWNFLMQ